MVHRRNCAAPLPANAIDLHHERHVVVGLEPVGDVVAQNRRCERAERFAPLDLGVEDVFHVGAPRIGQDRAVAQRPRSPLHAALEPAHDLAVGDGARDAGAQLVVIADDVDLAAGRRNIVASFGERRFDRPSIEGGPEIGVIHREARRLRLQPVPGGEGRPDGAAGVATS